MAGQNHIWQLHESPQSSRLCGLTRLASTAGSRLRCLLPLLLALTSARADSFNVVLQGTNGYRVPRIIGASGSIDSAKGFSGYDYFEWFGITHHRYWFKPSFSPLNPTGGVTNVASFNNAAAAVRANPLRQGTASDVYFDWSRFNSEFDADQRYTFQRFGQLGIVPMMVNTVLTGQDPLADWGNKFKYWKFWYAYVYFFASQYGVTMFEFRNEPSLWGSYAQWESHWLVAADAMRKAMADVNQNYGKSLELQICGPTMPGPYWDYSLPDPEVDPHGWGSVAWKKIHTDIYGNEDPSIWNFGMYDYHRYRTDGSGGRTEIATLRQNIANATNAPNATIPLLISEYNTDTGGGFTAIGLDTEDLTYGIATAQILQATATLGPDGLGDAGGLFLFKLGARDGSSLTLGNKTAYVSDLGDHNYGGVTRGGACFQLYARHFRGGKPLLGYTVSAGDSSQRRLVAVWDPARRAYYVYFSNVNGTGATATLDLSALDVQPGAPVSVARVDANNTGQITDYLSVDGTKKVTFNAPNNAALLVWIPQNTSAGTVLLKRPTNDTYLVVGETGTNHSAEPTMKVSLHHATASERRIGFLQFDLSSLAAGNRYLLKLPGHNIGASPTAREILHVYGAGSGTWSETNLTWAAAPGAGRYYTSTDSMAPATGLGSMVDIEDNYKGVTSGTGTGLGLCGKFLGPVSFYSSSWATNYVDVTDYVNSLIASNQTHATFVIARIVRYDVNQFSNSTYYTQGVYDCDGRIVELGTKENSNTALQSGLLVWASAPLYWSGAGTWYADASHANWGSSSGGPYTMTAWGDGYGHAAVFEGAAGVVTLNGTTYADSLTFNTSGYTVTATTNALFLGGGPNKTVTVTNGAGATIGAVVAGTANLAKAGAGTLSLTGGGFWTGATTVGAGTLQLAKPSGSGAASWSTPTITIANGGTLQLGSSDNFGNATATTSPAVTINAGGTVSNNGGAGNWFNTLWNLTLSGGTLYAQGGNASWGAYALGGTVTVNTAASTISGDGTANAWIDLNSAGTTFNVAEVTGNASADLTISAPIKGGSSGWNAGSLIKTGLGTLALSAANTYSGGTTVNGGTFLVNGSTASGSAVTVGASGTLGGNGTINGPVSVTAGGILSPGNNGFGTLTLANNSATALTLDRATVQCDLANVAGASDRVAISGGAGALVLNGANTITLYTPLGTAPAGTYTLMTYAAQTGSGTLALDQVYTNATLTVGTTSVTLTVTGSGTVGTLINRVWKGGLNANAWDTTTTNWLANGNAATYFDPSPVTFDDTGFASPGINIVSAVSPASVTVNSSIKAYSIGGAAIGGTGGLTKSGTATLTLSGSNTYSDGTTIAVGTLILSGGDNRLPANKLNFSGTSTLNISGGSQTLTNLTVADSVIGAVTGAGGSLRINGGDFRIGGTVGYAGQTLDMSSLGTFVYNGPNYTFDVGGEQAASGSSWEWGVLWLAATNTITAQTFGIQTVSDNRSATGNWNKGTNYLGRVNIINADTIRVGTIASGRSTPTGWLGFSTTTTGILTIGGTVGGTNRADITVGEINSSSQYPGATGIIDLTNNVTGTSTLTALVDQLLLGQHQGYNARAASGTFIMGGGILDANTIMIGQATSSATGAGSAEGCFSLNGGTVLVKTLTLGDQQTGSGNTVVGQMTMNGGNLAAQTLQSGAGTATQIFNWKSGTISNYDADTDLAIDIPTLTLDAGGTHTFNISAGRTATVSTVLTETNGAATLTKTGAGTVTLTGGNIYTGGTAVGNGTLLVNGSLDVGAVTLAANARLGGTGAINGAVTVNSGGTLAPGGSIGTLTINNNLTLAGNLLIEVNKSASPSNDLVVVSGTLTNAGAGTVTVTNIGATALVAGDRFVLFNKALFNGQALTITSGGGVVWTNKLALDGSIAVVSAAAPAVPATNLAIVAAGPASFSVSGRGGASQAYGLYASTNVVVPMTNWWLIGTTNSDGSGSIQFLDTHATNPQRFYRFGQ